jgi:hypothetical protein
MNRCDPKDITCSDATGLFFCPLPSKTVLEGLKILWWTTLQKKGLVFFSGLMTGGMEKPLDIGMADRSQCF